MKLKEAWPTLKLKCSVCSKDIEAYYGSWMDGGSCSRKCEATLKEKRYEMPHVQLTRTASSRL